jgi:nuclear pore complex protein Nup210
MALILLSSAIIVISTFVELAAASSPPHASSGPHIADVNLLLPPKMTFPVEYRLQGSDGCFKWLLSISIFLLVFLYYINLVSS